MTQKFEVVIDLYLLEKTEKRIIILLALVIEEETETEMIEEEITTIEGEIEEEIEHFHPDEMTDIPATTKEKKGDNYLSKIFLIQQSGMTLKTILELLEKSKKPM
mmetsp:Transcript_1521/g.2152  ORF Transcript_1521/g.2152 Transcript_1521/m.2152 type:complete len:105 (+) Transcript_1521:492-806(+)